MSRFLLSLVAIITVVSCAQDSTSPPPPPAGSDGNKLVARGDLAFGKTNNGVIDFQKGKDLVLAIEFSWDKDLKGTFRITELKTDAEKQIEQIPKPIDDQIKAQIEKLCFLSNTPHRWLVRHQGIDTEVKNGEVANFEFGSVLYLAIETRLVPKCERFFFNISSELLDSTRKPAPTPPPTPTPAPPVPEGSESVVLINPQHSTNFKITFDKVDGRNFTYKVSMLVDGTAFAQTQEVEKIFINIFDKTSSSYVADWTEIFTQAPAAPLAKTQRLEFSLDRFSAPTYLIDRQRDMVLTFAVNSPTESKLPLRSLELDKYCAKNSGAFEDARTGIPGCP